MIWYFYILCPYCENFIDGGVSFTSGLGPPTIICNKCNSAVSTDRSEWLEMKGDKKLKYVIYSLVVMLLAVFFGGLGADFLSSLWLMGPDEFLDKEIFTDQTALPGAVCGVLILLVLQVFRPLNSIKRQKRFGSHPVRLPFWNLSIALQFKLSFAYVLLLFSGWLVSYILYNF